MNIESLRKYCLKKKESIEDYPFDETTLVFKVMGKMFVLVSLYNVPLTINLKCDPEKAVELRERYDSVTPGYHMNKKYWNTVVLDNSIPEKEILSWIDDSYNLVVSGLKKKDQEHMRKI